MRRPYRVGDGGPYGLGMGGGGGTRGGGEPLARLWYNVRMAGDDSEMREFLLVVHRALLMIVRWIERRYGLRSAE